MEFGGGGGGGGIAAAKDQERWKTFFNGLKHPPGREEGGQVNN